MWIPPVSELPSGSGIKTERLSSVQSGGEVFRLVKSQDDRIAGSMPVWGPPETPQEEISRKLAGAQSRLSPETGLALSLASQDPPETSEDSFGFLDVLDVINPLQHIPVVSTLYRAVTGDQIKPLARIVGGAAFGGVLGAASGVVNAVVSAETGKDIGENVTSLFTSAPSSPPGEPDIRVASVRPRYND